MIPLIPLELKEGEKDVYTGKTKKEEDIKRYITVSGVSLKTILLEIFMIYLSIKSGNWILSDTVDTAMINE